MHPNPVYHTASDAQNLAFARERGFGVLAICAGDLPLLSHVPFLLTEDGAWADLHLVRSNPITRELDVPRPARIAVTGPDGYISPDWYGLADQVPTWNYVAVHLTGRLERLPDAELPDLLERQSAFFEDRLRPKPPWTLQKMQPGTRDRMMRMIVPCRMTVTAVAGTWKLSQNKPDDVRLRAADHVDGCGLGAETRHLAALMRDVDAPSSGTGSPPAMTIDSPTSAS